LMPFLLPLPMCTISQPLNQALPISTFLYFFFTLVQDPNNAHVEHSKFLNQLLPSTVTVSTHSISAIAELSS
jgi:hypothetical protein